MRNKPLQVILDGIKERMAISRRKRASRENGKKGGRPSGWTYFRCVEGRTVRGVPVVMPDSFDGDFRWLVGTRCSVQRKGRFCRATVVSGPPWVITVK